MPEPVAVRYGWPAACEPNLFNAAGLPGIGLFQDPIEYGTHTWHTNLDTYERAIEDDLKTTAIVIAAAIYHLMTKSGALP